MMDWVWIRPDWLWALLPWLALAIFLKAYRPRQANWHQLIAPHLQTKLVEPARRGGTTQTILLWAALLSIIALAGPSVRTQPSPLFSAQQARVVLMDMSLSMWATDVTPDRLTRLRYKAMDFLKLSKGGETGLIAYAGDAFVVSPLTADTKTLTNLMSALAPDVMPAFGSRPDLAVKKAIELLHQAGHHKGSLVLMTDGIGQEEADQIEQLLSRTDFKLHIYQIGSEMGAPIQLPNGELLKSGGQIQLPTSDFSISRQLSVRHGGSFITLTSDTTDIHYLADASQASASSQAERQQQSAQTREDAGPYLLGVILILVLSLFRKGAFALIACCAVWQPQPAHAMGWADLWQTPDQQGQQAFNQGDFAAASHLFDDPLSKGNAFYRQGDFQQAAEQYQQVQSATGHYNLGNALAQQQQLDEAINAYETALKLDPSLADAEKNLALVKRLREQQNQQNEEKGNQKDQQGDKNSSEQQSGDSSNSPTESDPNASSQEQNTQNESSSDADPKGSQQQEPSSTKQGEGNKAQNQTTKQDEATPQSDDTNTEGTKGKEEQDPHANQLQSQLAEQDQAQQQQRQQQALTNGQPSSEQAEQQGPVITEQGQGHEQGEPQTVITDARLEALPDDPSVLLRNKMLLEYRKRQTEGTQTAEKQVW